jgi:hypothetical protein
MTPPVLHVVFTPSGASLLQQALEDAGRDDRVVCFFDCPSTLPICRFDQNGPKANLERLIGIASVAIQRPSGTKHFPLIAGRSLG